MLPPPPPPPPTLSYFSLSSSMSSLWPSASHRVDELPVPVCFSRSSRFWRRSIWTSALRRSVSPSKVDLNIKTTTTFGSELQKGPLWHDVLTFWICLRVNKKSLQQNIRFSSDRMGYDPRTPNSNILYANHPAAKYQ